MRVLVLVLTVGTFLASATASHAVDKSAIGDAVDRGVAALKKMQRNDGTWPEDKVGATALAGLTLLECGVEDDNRAVTDAAAACRKVALTTTDTYSVALIILFLDRLDKPADTPLIEALLVNLLAGQNAAGGWSYNCTQAFTGEEQKAILDESAGKGPRKLEDLPAKGKRVATELPRTIQAKLAVIARGPTSREDGDNSNTQFATLALWAGRRYGVPTQAALVNVDARFRIAQANDGTWGYTPPARGVAAASGTATMTCAGLLGLACGHGARADVKKAKEKEKDKDKEGAIDVSADKNLTAGLLALGTTVGNPVGWKGDGQAPVAISSAEGKAFYYLWSLERVCVMLGLETLGKKDWYNWGAEILLKNQKNNGMWTGEYSSSGADTCFALLFLKKANLLRDLSSSIKVVKDPGERKLKSGGVGGDSLTGKKGKEDKTLLPSDIGKKPDEKKELTQEGKAAAKLGNELVSAKGKEREALLKQLRDTKGGEYTEALSEVIPKLEGETKKLAREALADRLTRMKATTLREYLKEKDPELRRAAAIATGQKDAKELIPDLIDLLSDDDSVRVAARASLKAMAGKDLGEKPEPWRVWWKKQAKE